MGNSQPSYMPQPSTVDGLIQALDYSVVCGIEIKNWTKHQLHSPKTTIQWGYVYFPPPTSINTFEKGSLIGHKCFGTATGTSGVLSYLIGNTKIRMFIMWSAPYNFGFFDNLLAVGFDSDHPNDIYDRMYDVECDDDNFSIEKYQNTCNIVKKTIESFTVSGIMGTSHKSKVEIELYEHVDSDDDDTSQ